MERVVITGIGLVIPNGIGTAEAWKAIVAGESGIGPITQFDASAYSSRIAGEVKGFDGTQYTERKKLKEMARFVQLSVAASKLAILDGGLEL
jgi:3-oxoacyl-[acyl-carrier-protein] synthase II